MRHDTCETLEETRDGVNPNTADHDYCRFQSVLLGIKCVSKYKDLQIFVLKLNKYKYFSATWSCE